VMRVAESLYSNGYISYPRTETSRYPPSFDVTAVLREQARHPVWGKTVNWLLQSSGGHVRAPTEGHDAGDHPPITPMKLAWKEDFTKGKEWRIYDLVCRHFIASLLPDVDYTEHIYSVDVGGQRFSSKWHVVNERGFLFAMPWKLKDLNLKEFGEDSGKGGCGKQMPLVPQTRPGQPLHIQRVVLDHDQTKHPEYLKESELITLMDKNGIGTDATMAQHIDNVVARHYTKVCEPSQEPGKPGPQILDKKPNKGKGKGKDANAQKPKARHMVPTGLGLAILDMFEKLTPDICEPPVRAFMEKQCAQVADGIASQEVVVRENIALFQDKFFVFQDGLASVAHILAPKNNGWNGGDSSWGQNGRSGWGRNNWSSEW